MNQLVWQKKILEARAKKFLNDHMNIHIGQKKYYGKEILSTEASGDWLVKKMQEGKPFAAGRIGHTEVRAMVACQPEQHSQKEVQASIEQMRIHAGFYGDAADLDRFVRMMEESIHEMDYIGVWFNKMEDYMIHTYGGPGLTLGTLEGLEPWYNPLNPWSKELAGKKVVCLHPFKKSIERQYPKRELFFKGTEICPSFELTCVEAVQSIGGKNDDRFPTWFDAFDYMYEEVMKVDCDVVLIACGAYGFPLATEFKKQGKMALQLGGALQLLFGLRGNRWENFAPLEGFYNDAWSRPEHGESLKDDKKREEAEGCCYW